MNCLVAHILLNSRTSADPAQPEYLWEQKSMEMNFLTSQFLFHWGVCSFRVMTCCRLVQTAEAAFLKVSAESGMQLNCVQRWPLESFFFSCFSSYASMTKLLVLSLTEGLSFLKKNISCRFTAPRQTFNFQITRASMIKSGSADIIA